MMRRSSWQIFADFIDGCCREYADNQYYRQALMQELPKNRRDLLAQNLPPLRRPPQRRGLPKTVTERTN